MILLRAVRGRLAKWRLTPYGNLTHRRYWRIRTKFEEILFSDKRFLEHTYRRTSGHTLNLRQPVRFTEKLQWLKLFYRDDRISQCSDKFDVRKFISDEGFGYTLNELIGVYDSFDAIDFDSLPDKFVMKAAHGSGWNLIVRDKEVVNWKIWRKIANLWLKSDLSTFGREWCYRDLNKRIVIERYLEDETGGLRDYKIMCLNGKPVWVQLDEGRFDSHKRVFVDPEGAQIPMTETIFGQGIEVEYTDAAVVLPSAWDEMLSMATSLSSSFPCVRVDLYLIGGQIVFGELTFFDGSGFYAFEPEYYDLLFGTKLVLPSPNHNLELWHKLRA